jgi:hypothetical protein
MNKLQILTIKDLNKQDLKNKDFDLLDIKKSINYAAARKIRIKELEQEVIKDADLALKYASSVIRGEWLEGEDIISSNINASTRYAKLVISKRFTKAEPLILQECYPTLYYVRTIIKQRFPEGEQIIASKPDSAYIYAKEYIFSRWPEAEKTISTNAEYSFLYAEFINDKFPMAHKTIFTSSNSEWRNKYLNLLEKLRINTQEIKDEYIEFLL